MNELNIVAIHRVFFAGIMFCLAWASNAYATSDAEAEQLTRISQEIARLEGLVRQASKSADPSARITFRYDWLASDLEAMRSGVDRHLAEPRQPRPIPPLQLDYRR